MNTKEIEDRILRGGFDIIDGDKNLKTANFRLYLHDTVIDIDQEAKPEDAVKISIELDNYLMSNPEFTQDARELITEIFSGACDAVFSSESENCRLVIQCGNKYYKLYESADI